MNLPSTYIALDLETTGVNPNSARIVQLAITHVHNSVIANQQSFLINPGKKKVTPEAYAIHGYSNEMLADKPMFNDLAWDIFELLNDTSPVITYNGEAFDLVILQKEFDRVDVAQPAISEHFDVYKLAKQRLALHSYKQAAVAEHLKIRNPNPHDALNDTTVLVAIFERLKLKPPLDTANKPVDPSKYALQIRKHADAIRTAPPAAQTALQLLSPHIPSIAAAVEAANRLDCDTEEEYQTTVQTQILLKRLDKQLTSIRTNAVRDIKATIKAIESAWRDNALNPIKGALTNIQLLQEPYLRQQHELREQARLKIEEEARQLAASIQERKQHYGMKQSDAKDWAETVADEYRHRQTSELEQMGKTQTKLGSAHVKVKYACRVIDPTRVPKHLWSPDLAKIEQEANESNGRDIPGVEITPTFQHTTRAKAR